uniref:CRIB domain-containing protein n=1 Tax=Megaselia scalaris TaxID=36166 RepID=T1H2X8_MEGSC
MISRPQDDFKHTGHVGIDGASFGDISFLSNPNSSSPQNFNNHVPRQIVTPYKPSEDIEQTPLLLPPTPTSPDSLQTASGYFSEIIFITPQQIQHLSIRLMIHKTQTRIKLLISHPPITIIIHFH